MVGLTGFVYGRREVIKIFKKCKFMSLAEEMIEDSGLSYFRDIEFEKKSKGRFFQKNPHDLGNGAREFVVILGPNVESPVHNHQGENMAETHLLLYGSGRFEVYDRNGQVSKVVGLELGRFHEIFSTPSHCPSHKYIAGPNGSICLALEIYE